MKLFRTIDTLTRRTSTRKRKKPVTQAAVPMPSMPSVMPKPKAVMPSFGRSPKGFDAYDPAKLAKFLAVKAAERAGKTGNAAAMTALNEAATILIEQHGAFDGPKLASLLEQDQADIEAIRSDPANVEIWINIAVKLLVAFASKIPDDIDAASLGVTMEASGVAFGLRDLIGQWALILSEKEGHAAQVLKPWRRAVRDNMKSIQGVRLDQRASRPEDIFPSSRVARKSAYAYAHDAFRGTPMLDLLHIHLPVPVPYHVRTQHMHVVGPSGSGKSMFLKNLLLGDIRSGHGVFLVDCEGDLSESVLWHAASDPNVARRIVYIDPAKPDLSPTVNPLSIGGIGDETELTTYIMGALGEGFTGKMGGFFESLADVMSEIEGATLDTLIDFLTDDGKAQFYLPQLSEENQDWVINDFPSGTNAQTRDYVRGRLRRMRRSMQAFRGKVTSYDPASLLDQGKIVIVRVSSDPVASGGLGSASSLASRFYIASFVMAGLQRRNMPDHLWLGHLDEAAEQLGGGDDSVVATAFARLRKRGVALSIYHQQLAQLKGELKEAVLGNTGIKLAGKLKPADREKMAEAMSCSRSLFNDISKKDFEWAEMVCSIDQVTEQGALCRFPLGAMEQLPRLSRDEHARLMDNQRAFWTGVNGTPDDVVEEKVVPMRGDRHESTFL